MAVSPPDITTLLDPQAPPSQTAGMRGAAFGLLTAAGIVAALAFGWPLLVVASELATCDEWSAALPGARGWGLLARGVGIAIAATGLALVLGTLLAAGLVRRRAGRAGGLARLLGGVCLLVLLTPPYLYAYAWSLPLLPEGIAVAPPNMRYSRWVTGELRAVWCLSTWCSPIAAGLLASGWRRAGATAYRLALLDGGSMRALIAAAGPLRPWIVLAAVVILLASLVEFSICHLCQVLTWNTEILVQTQALERPGRSLLLAWPQVLIAIALLGVLVAQRRLIVEWIADVSSDSAWMETDPPRGGPEATIASVTGAGLLLLPMLIFIASMQDWRAMGRLWRVYPSEWPGSLLTASGATLACGVLALAAAFLASMPPGRRAARLAATVIVASATVAAVIPPALAGDLFAAAYAGVPPIRDRFWIISLVEASRFAFIPVVAGVLAARAAAAELREGAAADGAAPAATFFHVILPEIRSPLILALGVVAALSLTEVAASQLVAPPGVGNLARTLLNAIHFGRNDDVIALALTVVAVLFVVVAGRSVMAERKGHR